MTIINLIRRLYKDPSTQTNVNFRPGTARNKKLLEPDNTRVYMRLQNKQATGIIHIYFGQEPESEAQLIAEAAIVLPGTDETPVNVFTIEGEHCWKGEVWANSAGTGNTLNCLAYGAKPLPFPGVR